MTDFNASYFLDGQILLIDKPLTWTSFDVVNKLRHTIKQSFGLKKIKVGHAGTLDPLATGLLIVCTGKQTKQINEYMGQPKEYTGSITFGSTTPSYDLETEADAYFDTKHLTTDLLHETTKQFTGSIEQIPPIFSAIKKDGKKAYELARAGEAIELKARTVEVSNFEITNFENNVAHFKVNCSKGTYIRSLAHDFGKALHTGAHLSSLRRTAIGTFKVEDAIEPLAFVEELAQYVKTR